MAEHKKSFWRFGGKLDTAYNWIVAGCFVLSAVVQIGRFGTKYVPEALGRAIGQTVWIAIILFVIFKIISASRKSSS